MKKLLAFLIGLTLATNFALGQLPKLEKLVLRSATPAQSTTARYGRIELLIDLRANYDNPFDPEQIDLHAVFTSPAGKAVRVNGFLDQTFTRTFTRKLDGGTETINSVGDPVWKIRFAPDRVGKWRYRVAARERTGSAELPEATFDVTAAASPGFIRRSERNPRAFAYDDGRPFFAIGENMCWAGGRGTFDYDDWLASLSNAGGNWIRIWMSSWNCALEWSREGTNDWRSGGYSGVGFYNLRNAWKLDTILHTCEQHAISAMLCFGTYGNPEVWNIPELDVTQTHSYGKGDLADHAPKVHQDAQEHAGFGKPHLVGEFGIDWRAPDSKYDPDQKGVNLYGLVHGNSAILWAQNPAHHWKNVFEKKPAAAVPGHEIVVRGLPTDRYAIEWWDTWKGEVTNREPAECKDGKLALRLPELATDVAARIVPAP